MVIEEGFKWEVVVSFYIQFFVLFKLMLLRGLGTDSESLDSLLGKEM